MRSRGDFRELGVPACPMVLGGADSSLGLGTLCPCWAAPVPEGFVAMPVFELADLTSEGQNNAVFGSQICTVKVFKFVISEERARHFHLKITESQSRLG